MALVDVPVVGTASYEWPVALAAALATEYPIQGAGLWLPLYGRSVGLPDLCWNDLGNPSLNGLSRNSGFGSEPTRHPARYGMARNTSPQVNLLRLRRVGTLSGKSWNASNCHRPCPGNWQTFERRWAIPANFHRSDR